MSGDASITPVLHETIPLRYDISPCQTQSTILLTQSHRLAMLRVVAVQKEGHSAKCVFPEPAKVYLPSRNRTSDRWMTTYATVHRSTN